MELTVHHDHENHFFWADCDGKTGELDYREVDNNTLDFYYTHVDPELRGQGIANEIVKEALDYASLHHFKVKPSCWFVRAYIEQHPEYQPLTS